MQPVEYEKLFPGAEAIAETVRARPGKRKGVNASMPRLVFPHWESIPSAEYTLDRICEAKARVLHLSTAFIYRTEPSLPAYARRFWGSWQNALQIVGAACSTA